MEEFRQPEKTPVCMCESWMVCNKIGQPITTRDLQMRASYTLHNTSYCYAHIIKCSHNTGMYMNEAFETLFKI